VVETARFPEPTEALATKVCCPVFRLVGTSKLHCPSPEAVVEPMLLPSTSIVTRAFAVAVPDTVGVASLMLDAFTGPLMTGDAMLQLFDPQVAPAGQSVSERQRTQV
jgi:hypothetical protein